MWPLRLFKQIFWGGIWQLPSERNTTDRTNRTDRTDRSTGQTGKAWSTFENLTFLDTYAGQLSQFLRCFCLWLESVFKDGEKFLYEILYLYRDLLSQFQSFQIYCRQELNPSRLESTNTDLLHGTKYIYIYKNPSPHSYKLYHLSCLTAICLVFEVVSGPPNLCMKGHTAYL